MFPWDGVEKYANDDIATSVFELDKNDPYFAYLFPIFPLRQNVVNTTLPVERFFFFNQRS